MKTGTASSHEDSLRAVWLAAESNFSGPAPEARCGHACVSIKNESTWGDEFIIIHGGINRDREALGTLSVLSLEQGSWITPGAPGAEAAQPPPRAFHAAAALGERLYVFGGHRFLKDAARLHTYGDMWALDTRTWEWRRCGEQADGQPARAPCARDRAALVPAPDGASLLLYGGADASNRRLDDLWLFDSEHETWTEISSVGPRPRPRCSATLCALPNRLLLFGGDTYGVSAELWSLNVPGITTSEKTYDAPRLATWTALSLDGAAPAPRRAHAAAAAAGKGLVVFGGWTEFRSLIGIKNRGQTLEDVSVLDRREQKLEWRQAQPESGALAVPAAREKHSLTAVSDGRLFLFGGTDGRTTLGDAWWLQVEEWETGPRRRASEPSPEAPAAPAPPAAPPSEPYAGLAAAGLAYLPAVPFGLTSAFTSLRDRLGLPSNPSAPDLLPVGVLASEFDPDLLALGRRELGLVEEREADRGRAAQAARAFLATCTPQELRLGDVQALVSDYRRLARAGFLEALRASAGREAVEPLPGRFMHLQAQDLRMREVGLLLEEYRVLLASQFGTA